MTPLAIIAGLLALGFARYEAPELARRVVAWSSRQMFMDEPRAISKSSGYSATRHVNPRTVRPPISGTAVVPVRPFISPPWLSRACPVCSGRCCQISRHQAAGYCPKFDEDWREY